MEFSEYTNTDLGSPEITGKEKRWQEIGSECTQITDKLGKPIDEGILTTIVGLRAHDFKTVASCEGHTEWGHAYPWVNFDNKLTPEALALQKKSHKYFRQAEKKEIAQDNEDEINELYEEGHRLYTEYEKIKVQETARIMKLLEEFYQDRITPYDRIIIIHNNSIMSQGGLVSLIQDEDTRQKKLGEYQAEMQAFAEFLKQKYFAS